MKNFFSAVLISILLLSVTVYAGNISEKEKATIQKAIAGMIGVDATRVESSGAKKVFAATIYLVDLFREGADGSRFGMGKFLLAQIGAAFVEPEGTQTSKTMPNLKSIIKNDFRLNSQKDAEFLQDALDSIYKIGSSSDQKAKAIIQKGNEWIFVRGAFFKKKKGFVFKVDKGVITEIQYSLGIEM
jgi:hypothetical protein